MGITITSDEKGNVHFPDEMGIKPKEKPVIDKMDDMVIIKKMKNLVNIKEAGNKIVDILKRNLKGITSRDMEKSREDRSW